MPSIGEFSSLPLHAATLTLQDSLPAGVIATVLACFATALVTVSIRRREQ